MKPLFTGLAAVGLGAAVCSAAIAQDKVPDSQAKPPPAIENAPPDKIGEPLSTGTVGGFTLSDELNKSEGVIKPPSGVDPAMQVPAPESNPGSTIVIPPPGEPGGNQDIQPK
jgi:hypothetical protein